MSAFEVAARQVWGDSTVESPFCGTLRHVPFWPNSDFATPSRKRSLGGTTDPIRKFSYPKADVHVLFGQRRPNSEIACTGPERHSFDVCFTSGTASWLVAP